MSKVPASVPASGFVDDRFLAENTPFTRSFYQHARLRGEGPPSYKLGRRSLYKWIEVLAWLESQLSAPAGGGAS